MQLVGKRVANVLLVIIELFVLAVTAEESRADICQSRCFKGDLFRSKYSIEKLRFEPQMKDFTTTIPLKYVYTQNLWRTFFDRILLTFAKRQYRVHQLPFVWTYE